VHFYAKGIPRLINLICEHSLISAYVEQIKPIPARTVEAVSAELDLQQQPFVLSPLAMNGLPEDAVRETMSHIITPVETTEARKENKL
jgi:hypothetical protein